MNGQNGLEVHSQPSRRRFGFPTLRLLDGLITKSGKQCTNVYENKEGGQKVEELSYQTGDGQNRLTAGSFLGRKLTPHSFLGYTEKRNFWPAASVLMIKA